MQNITYGNIILAHKGALGDFLLAWPVFLSIRAQFPEAQVYWHGKDAFLPWLGPIGIKKLHSAYISALDGLYSSTRWPETLDGFKVFWFGLDRVTIPGSFHELLFLKAVQPGEHRHVRRSYINSLNELGISYKKDWHLDWINLFGRHTAGRKVLLFPGSGNPAKNWPLERFLDTARYFEQEGFSAVVVLGPAEEHLQIPGDLQQARCTSLKELQNLVLEACLMLGNDSGPMHLGAMFKKPGLVLFGPTPVSVWRPEGIQVLKTPADCAPCSWTARIRCSNPICMAAIDQRHVKSWGDKFLNRLPP
ncbi:glycosyltransferase family 9 protein [Desulfonatronospira sp.]|uniref:glycosyltransferase family 9 protein n=1 Tax=Desulfonatronospira sp. TaxID=1962951 RepID=UPI0025C1CCF3|nr:glycosyltransferase family 9 protein [Desulfonatronospira sp.]